MPLIHMSSNLRNGHRLMLKTRNLGLLSQKSSRDWKER